MIKHLSTRELSTRWGVRLSTLERWRANGLGPRFLRIGARVVYRVSDVEAYEQAHCFISTHERVQCQQGES